MNSFIFLICILNVLCTRNLIKINETLVLENSFWEKNEISDDYNNKFLKLVMLNVWNHEQKHSIALFNAGMSHFNSNEKKFYHLINSDITKIILSYLKGKKEVVLKFDYVFNHLQSKNEPSTSDFKLELTKCYDYKTLTIDQNGNILFKGDNPSINKSHIKLIMSKLIQWKSRILEIYDTDLDDQFTDQTSKFTLLYFESISLCFEYFKKFIDFIKWRKNGSNVNSKKGSIENYGDILKIFELKQNLNIMLDGDYNEIDKEDYQYFHGKARFLFNKFLNELRILLSSGNVVLPIGGIYTKQFYYGQIYRQMKGLIEGMFNEICPYFHRFPPSIYEDYVCKFRTYIKNLSNLVTSDVWESLNLEEYVTDLLNKDTLDVDDYVKADKVFCDFHNMILYILTRKNVLKGVVSNPIFADITLIDKLKCKLKKAYEIEFKDTAFVEEIKAFDSEGNEIELEKDIDLFYDPFTRNKKIIFLIETIRRKNIQTIELFSTDQKLLKKFIFQNSSKNIKSWWDCLTSFKIWLFES